MEPLYKTIQRPRFFFLCFVISASFAVTAAWGQNKLQQKVPEKTRILFVLDGSGSMEALWHGQQSKMDVAKNILTKLVDSLRINNDLELGLRVYGHRFSRQANNCQDSNLEVPFAPKNHNTIIGKIKAIKPKGVTPITFSLLQAAKDFPATAGYRNILILITDGIESCGGDPCAVSLELQRKGVFLRPYVIGLGLQGGRVLDCVGKYIDSDNSRSFNKVLNKSIETSLAKTTVSVELLNGDGKPVETSVNVTFTNAITNVAAYEFVHYRDKQGRPDSVQVDPVPTYDITVNTVPPVIVKNPEIVNGTHNVITIAVPQGRLVARPEGRGNAFSFVVRQKGRSEILNQQRSGELYRYLAGEYEVETLTLPRRIFAVSIKADQTETIMLPSTGLVNINTLSPGIGSLFEILESGETRWVCHLEETAAQHSYNLLPGKYKIAFRVRQAAGSKYTAIKTFELKSGQTLNLNMFN
ncbi:VWA domain-containing protein [Fulvivirgaceae bacterium PWU4]|uniref:VWA domain-containing protein n=1 Tax=Chryseosolibacter histidini TaxID=2782349 RepID=A0AAP2DM04_9BACT|nr:VWA domain-containing protein [Chryseosolibacter histidini]MBT1697738.1 VWA domain-containing protein [Chryseosolibacter histidini]